jgi:hypothetical protein
MSHRRKRLIVFIITAIVWGAVAMVVMPVLVRYGTRPVTSVEIVSEPFGSDSTMVNGRPDNRGDIGEVLSFLRPSSGERWIFYAVTGKTRERIWSFDHFAFDFIKGGNEPFHVIGTRLERNSLIAVYKEHGATWATIVKKDAPPPEGAGQWELAGTQLLWDDDESDGSKVTTAAIRGRISDQTMQVQLSRSKPGEAPNVANFKLDWAGSEPKWNAN